MTKPFTKIYPNTGDAIITLDGGLNSYFPQSTIQDNESPDALNVVHEDGTVKTRQGTTLINTASVGSFAGNGLFTRHDRSGAETMVAFWNGSAFDLQGTSFITIPSAQSIFTTGINVGSCEYENHQFYGNGGSIPYKYNGTDWTRHGIYPPTATMTAATNSNGTLTGDVFYKVTYVNSQSVESDVNTRTATFTATAEDVLISSIPVAPQSWGVSARKLYRASVAAGTYKYLATINDNSTTTYVDNSDWSELGDNAPTDQGVPPTYGFIITHQDRLWSNDPGNLNYAVYSELGNPYVFKATNFFKVGDNSGKLLRALHSYPNGVLLVHDDGFAFVYMPDTDDTNWIRYDFNINYGTRSPFGLVSFQQRVLFPAMRSGKTVGIGALMGDQLEPDITYLSVMKTGGELISAKIANKMKDIEEGQESKIVSIEYQNKIYFAVTTTDSGTANDRVFVLDYNIDNLSKVQRYAWDEWTNLRVAYFTIYDGNLYYQDALATGRVFKMLDGTYNDNGSAINSYMITKEFTGFKNDENFSKDHRFINALVEMAGAWSMNIYARVDSSTNDGDRYIVDLTPTGALFGTAVFGVDVFAASEAQKDIKIFLGGLRGKRVQFKFSNQNVADQWFKVHWMKYAYNKKGYR